VAEAARAVSLWLAGVMAMAVLSLQLAPVLAPTIGGGAGLAPEFVRLFNAGLWAAALLDTLTAPALLARRGAWTLARACLLLCAAGLAAMASGYAAGLVLAALLIGLALKGSRDRRPRICWPCAWPHRAAPYGSR
jgi:hypothetical protein